MTNERLNTKMVTPVIIASYPHLAEKSEDASGNLCYSMQILIDANDEKALSQLKQIMENAAFNKWGKSISEVGAVHYIADGDADDEIQVGKKRFSAKSFSRRPQCVYLNLEEIPLERIDEVIYPGAQVRASISAYGTDKGNKNTIAFGLNNVMFVGEGKRIGGASKATDDFSDYKDDSYQPDYFGEGGNDQGGDPDPKQGDLF